MTSTGEPGRPRDVWAAPEKGVVPAVGAPSAPQQPYAQQAYAQQPFGPLPNGSQPYQPGPVGRGTDGLAIAGFVFSIMAMILLSVPFCIAALLRVRKSRAGGRGLAIAGLVISALWGSRIY